MLLSCAIVLTTTQAVGLPKFENTMTTFILRLHNTNDGTYSLAVIDLPSGTSLEEATEIAIDDLDDGLILERITNADTKESGQLRSIAKGFGA